MLTSSLNTTVPPKLYSSLQINMVILNKTVTLKFVLLNKEHIKQIMILREQVLSTLIHSDCYIREQDEYEFVAQHCGALGETLGVFSENKLIAYASLSYQNTLAKEDLGFIVKLSPRVYDQVSQLACCMIAPAFQRMGLHKMLIKRRIALAHARGYFHCFAVVSPHNMASRHNLFQSGFQIHWAGHLPGLSTQHILYSHIQQRSPKLEIQLTQQVEVHKITQQQRLLQQGYYGYAQTLSKAPALLFAPLSSS